MTHMLVPFYLGGRGSPLFKDKAMPGKMIARLVVKSEGKRDDDFFGVDSMMILIMMMMKLVITVIRTDDGEVATDAARNPNTALQPAQCPIVITMTMITTMTMTKMMTMALTMMMAMTLTTMMTMTMMTMATRCVVGQTVNCGNLPQNLSQNLPPPHISIICMITLIIILMLVRMMNSIMICRDNGDS